MIQERTPSACFGQLVCFHSNDNYIYIFSEGDGLRKPNNVDS